MRKTLKHFNFDNNILMFIPEDAHVIDQDGCTIGVVDDVFLGAFDRKGTVDHVFKNGYVHVTGSNKVSWFVLPDQVEDVREGKVVLNAAQDDLIPETSPENSVA